MKQLRSNQADTMPLTTRAHHMQVYYSVTTVSHVASHVTVFTYRHTDKVYAFPVLNICTCISMLYVQYSLDYPNESLNDLIQD